MQLKPLVSSVVKSYLTDFTVHDKESLKEIWKTKGKFIIGFRTMGTSFYNFKHTQKLVPEDIQKCLAASIDWMTRSDKVFFYGHDGIIQPITKNKVIKLITEHVNNMQNS